MRNHSLSSQCVRLSKRHTAGTLLLIRDNCNFVVNRSLQSVARRFVRCGAAELIALKDNVKRELSPS